jgi:hypothetical protein
LVFSELSEKWPVFLGLYSWRPQTLVKHSRGPSDRAQLMVSLKRSQSLVAYSSISDLVSSQGDRQSAAPTGTMHLGNRGQMSAHGKGIGFLDMVAPPLHSSIFLRRSRLRHQGKASGGDCPQ